MYQTLSKKPDSHPCTNPPLGGHACDNRERACPLRTNIVNFTLPKGKHRAHSNQVSYAHAQIRTIIPNTLSTI